MKLEIISVLFLSFVSYDYYGVGGVPVEIDLKLTDAQKKIMDRFRSKMIPKLPHAYMHEEIYLVRWLRARDFDVEKAEEFLLQNLKWRKQNKIESVHREDWSDMAHDFPYTTDSLDKHGRPVMIAIARDWNLRNAVVTGRIKRLLRYLDKGMDDAAAQVRKLQLQGKNVTQFSLLLHMGNFNLYQHGCPRCITGILEFLDSYENHFPGMADRIILVQTPPVFDAIAQLVREGMTEQTREAFKIYGMDPKVWKKVLEDLIGFDQLPDEFGGTKPDSAGEFNKAR